jgi:hypothetical protein
MARKPKDPRTQLVELLSQVLSIAQALAPQQPEARTAAKPGNHSGAARGVYPHQSKYNPWRAYVWDTKLRKSVYLGAFPSVAKARAAQKAYAKAEPVKTGTKAALRIVASDMGAAA